MAPAWKAAWVSSLSMLLMSSTRAAGLQHDESEATHVGRAGTAMPTTPVSTTGGCVSVEDVGALSEGSMSFTATLTSYPTDWAYIYASDVWTAGAVYLVLGMTRGFGAATLDWGIYPHGSNYVRFQDWTMPLNVPCRIHMTFSLGPPPVYQLWVDGSLVSTGIASGNLATAGFNAGSIGCCRCGGASWAADSQYYWPGSITDFVITDTFSHPAPLAAVGDPHLQNEHGERFDLMKEGNHVLISIPRGVSANDAYLRVEARATKLGGQCDDLYFTSLNITGSWARPGHAGGYHYQAQQETDAIGTWVAAGKVELKVVRGRTGSGVKYLNFYVRHLGLAGFDVGGLLGEEDHSEVSVPPAGCVKQLRLGKRGRVDGGSSSPTSVAIAAFA